MSFGVGEVFGASGWRLAAVSSKGILAFGHEGVNKAKVPVSALDIVEHYVAVK